MDRFLRAIVVILLAGILVMLVAIYQRIPESTTYGDFIKAKGKDRREARMRLPIVGVTGEVDVSGSSVDVTSMP
jgi:hypothetical protein